MMMTLLRVQRQSLKNTYDVCKNIFMLFKMKSVQVVRIFIMKQFTWEFCWCCKFISTSVYEKVSHGEWATIVSTGSVRAFAVSLSHQPIAGGRGREKKANNEMEAALVSEMMDWIPSLCICHCSCLPHKTRSRKLAGRLRAVRFSLTWLHWGPMGVLPLTPGSSWEKAGEIILASLSTQRGFLWTDLHPQSLSCDANLPSNNPPRQGHSEPPPLPLCLEAAVFG